jgi:RNA polymerase sigma factor (sigma-70 family)
MANNSSDSVLRQVHRLFNFGAVGAMSDAQLLDRFVSRRDDAAAAAFEELVIRHGPMVLRVCRSVLRDAHDAEDAFQAVFLVLASRSRSIRRTGSVASWLFGVAHRVATRARRSAARRRKLDRLIAEQNAESEYSRENDPDWGILHEEIEGLPERLRAPVVLCYLQGLTYAAAAHQLGFSEAAIRGRLARARERLRQRLTRRGVTVPAGLLVAGAAGEAQAAIPLTLIQGTIRIALGFMAGNTAAVLAREVLNSMLLNQLKVATVLLCLGIGSSYCAWHALAGATDENGRSHPGQVAKAPAAAPKPQTTRPAVAYRLTGSVRVEGTGEPVAGATVDVMIADSGQGHRGANRTALSGADGRFLVDLPPGSARAWTLTAPVGYWVPENRRNIEEFAVSKDQPVHHKDYVVRRGAVWDFRITRALKATPLPGVVVAFDKGTVFRSAVDDAGRARLTLPTEGGKVRASAGETIMAADPVEVTLEWESGFRPDDVASVTNLRGSSAHFRLSDHNGKTATMIDHSRIPFRQPGSLDDHNDKTAKLSGSDLGRATPRLDGGELVVEVTLPEPAEKVFGDLTGKVVDTSSKPIAGALVALIWVEEQGGSGMSSEDGHTATTGAQGAFRLRSIRSTSPTGKPVTIQLSVTKEGYAGVDTRRFRFQPGAGDAPQVAETVSLAPGVSVSGIVVDPEGKPLAGAWIEPVDSYANRSQFTKTDDAGRFTIRDLPTGMVRLGFHYGKLMQVDKYLASPNADPLTIKLRPVPDAAEFQARSDAAKAARDRARPLALGTPSPEWDSGAWSDGRARRLADYRGKVVVLNFWGVWCGPCLGELPSLEKLRAKYEPRGVVFLTLHTPGKDEKTIGKVLEMKKASLLFAVDRGRNNDEFNINGVTAGRYGVKGYPTLVMIDRQGKLAFHTGIDPKESVAAMKSLGGEMGLKESTMTEADFLRLWEVFFGREIEKILKRS